MNELEDGLERLIDQMGKMILDLLGLLYVEEVETKAAQPI